MTEGSLRYTFAELLHIFYILHKPEEMTHDILARRVGISLPTLRNWLSGRYRPQRPEQIVNVAASLALTLHQTDLLLYSANPAWVKYGTPIEHLHAMSILRYEERRAGSPVIPDSPPPPGQIEDTWLIKTDEPFLNNTQHWGTGWKDDGVCTIERTICAGRYQLTVKNRFHSAVFLGGDSHLFAPAVYYLTVEAWLSQGDQPADGIALLLDEISDSSFVMFRLRPHAGLISVIETRNGGNTFTSHIEAQDCTRLLQQGSQVLSVLADHNRHWFFLNGQLIQAVHIPRIPHTRLDVGVTASPFATVTASFSNLVIRVPPVEALDALQT